MTLEVALDERIALHSTDALTSEVCLCLPWVRELGCALLLLRIAGSPPVGKWRTFDGAGCPCACLDRSVSPTAVVELVMMTCGRGRRLKVVASSGVGISYEARTCRRWFTTGSWRVSGRRFRVLLEVIISARPSLYAGYLVTWSLSSDFCLLEHHVSHSSGVTEGFQRAGITTSGVGWLGSYRSGGLAGGPGCVE
jgi:hypothetical protein